MTQILVIRPEPGASATVTAAAEIGLRAKAFPLFAVEAIDWRAPDPAAFDALLFTSANAPRHGGAELALFRHLPAYGVGETTASAAREAGFTIAGIGTTGVEELLGEIEPELRLLHLCGEDRTDVAKAHQSILPIPVYRSTPIEPDGPIDGMSGSVVLVHSPRSAMRLRALLEQSGADRSTMKIAAISAKAAAAAGPGWARVSSAAEPTDRALLALARELCNDSLETR